MLLPNNVPQTIIFSRARKASGIYYAMDLLELFSVKEAYELPDVIMAVLFSDRRPEALGLIKDNGIINIRDYYQKEQGDRKKLKQDFTPDCVCEIVAGLMKEGSFLDMCAGTGALSKAAISVGHAPLHEQEWSKRAIAFNLLDACLSGYTGIIDQADCLRGCVSKTYELISDSSGFSFPIEKNPSETGQYQNVIMNPPYSLKFPDARDFRFYGLEIPKSKADYGFVLQGLKHLDEGGRLIAVLPQGVLFRGSKEEAVRRWLIDNKYISAVIGLPDKLFLNTDIPVCLLVLEAHSDDILFINAFEEYEKDGSRNIMTSRQVQKVINTFKTRAEVKRYSHIADAAELEENGYNLNIPRYVDTFVPEPLPDMDKLMSELEQINKEEEQICSELVSSLRELRTSDKEAAKVIDRHINLLEKKASKPQNFGEQIRLTL